MLMGAFMESYEGCVEKAWGNPLTHQLTDVGEFVKPIDLGSVGAVRQFSGPRQSTKPRVYTLTQQNVPWEISMEIDVEDVNRDKLGMFETKAKEMGSKFADHPTKLLIQDLLNNPICFDGTAFFGTHTVGTGTIINDVSATQIPALAAAIAAAPTAVEMSNIVTQILGYFYTFIDEAGDPINGDAREFMFATSNPTVKAAIDAVIFSEQITQGQTNLVRAGWEVKGWRVNSVLDPRLGSLTNTIFYMFRTDSIVKPFIWAEETPLHLQYLGEGSDNAVKNNKYLWGTKAVRSVGVGRYQHCVRATLS